MSGRALLSSVLWMALCACGASETVDVGAGGGGSLASSSSATSSAHGSGGATSASTGSVSIASATSGSGGGSNPDADGDGIDDATEAQIAASYRPYLSLAPGDNCPVGGILYRVMPYPNVPGLVFVLYDHLFDKDCGLTGHPGDDEAFGAMIDPSIPPPDGVLAIRAIGHQNTVCEQTSECGSCGNRTACTMAGTPSMPVVFSSKDKHASYADPNKCMFFSTCLDSCGLASQSDEPPMVNAGEPDAHLVEDLTTQGFITEANGWTQMQLFHFNPWAAGVTFGGAGVVADDLVDPSFIPAACP